MNRTWTSAAVTFGIAIAALVRADDINSTYLPTEKEKKEILEQEKRREKTMPLPTDKSAAAMKLPQGFSATLFAGEPDLHQPIAFIIDHKGRLWVAENYSYPQWRETSKDRISIYEDTDGDGKFDSKKVFAEGFHYLTGLQIGTGGLWVADAPNLLFFPINPGEDKPAGPPVVHLDGWNWRGKHNVLNSLTWGPDGWLYGLNGITVDSLVGPPGTPNDQRTRLNCSVWRYHPTRKIFEAHAQGTTNPWGLDYDERGQMFISNNVLPHLWHVIQGARYRRMFGQHFNPYTYGEIQTIADHLHWGGGEWQKSRTGEAKHSEAGGGHSHAGLAFYFGDSFPADYRGTAFLCNTHGNRVNNDIIRRKDNDSGFVATHRPDFMLANDKWFHGVTAHVGPEGALYVSDWSDTGECHDYDVTDREHGRLYKIAYQGTSKVTVDLEKESDQNLVQMQTGTNEWFVRHARMVLHARALRDNGLQQPTRDALLKMFESSDNPIHRLRVMWMLHQCGHSNEAMLLKATTDPDESLRAWAIQLLAEDKHPSPAALGKFVKLAQTDESPLVRLYLASAAQRIPLDQRWPILEPLVSRSEDTNDQNLPLIYWYALEPVVGADPKSAASQILPKTKIPKLREFIVRRMAAK
jgi:putative membrane-bound dehydrogenase-like protein